MLPNNHRNNQLNSGPAHFDMAAIPGRRAGYLPCIAGLMHQKL